jgi:preprotein translocase subunit SecG
MSTVVTALHILVCLFLMLTVLLQQGKGGGMGGAFGGSNAGTVFGGAGASGFLRRLTAIAATVFMVTSMVLAFFASADAGDSLEKFSKEEAKRKKQANEAQLRLYDGDGGVAPDVADAGVMTIDPAVVPALGTTPTVPGGAAPTGVEVPVEIPAPTPTAPTPAAPTPAPAPTPPAAPPTAGSGRSAGATPVETHDRPGQDPGRAAPIAAGTAAKPAAPTAPAAPTTP